MHGHTVLFPFDNTTRQISAAVREPDPEVHAPPHQTWGIHHLIT
jgi:hypothetical protein